MRHVLIASEILLPAPQCFNALAEFFCNGCKGHVFLVACTYLELDMLDGTELCVSQFEDISLRLPTRRLHKIMNLPVLERMQGETKLKPPEGVARTVRFQ